VSALAAIFGCAGPTLTRAEQAFFADIRPWGFILFARNIETPDQVRALTGSLRAVVDRGDAPILIDQEGGRVQRLGPPHWRGYPSAQALGALAANDPLHRREIVRLCGRLIAHDLREVGINVDCAPVLDTPSADGHDVIGSRAFSQTPEEVAGLGRALAEGLIAGGVLPVIKHIPGHGRARSDSHHECPVVDAKLDALAASDFAPFRVLSDMPMAMTAHVIYACVDREHPASVSRRVIREVIRGAIGFEGLLMSDDLSMKALEGGMQGRAEAASSAGCDVVLHCTGDMAEMRAVALGAKSLRGRAKARAAAALGRAPRTPEPFDIAEARARLDAALEGGYAA
jgi:beta-N-acetylhexosaminidase